MSVFPALPPVSAVASPRASRWSATLDRPARPTPLLAWFIALLAAVLVGVSVASPKIAVVVLGIVLIVAVAARVVARPMNGFYVLFAIFPFYTLARGVAMVYHLPIPLTLTGMWTEMILCLMFASLLVAAASAKRSSLRFTWDDAPMVCLVLSCLYGVLLSVSEKALSATVYGIHTSLTPFLFYFAARWLRPAEAELGRFVRVWLAACLVLALVSLVDYALRPAFFIKIAVELRPGFGIAFNPYDFYRWYPRMQSLMFAEQVWGTLCAAISLFCLACTGTLSFTRRAKWQWWLVFTLFTLCLMLSMSRGALICWLVGLGVLALFRGQHRKYIALLAVIGVIGIAALLAIFGGDARVRSLVLRVSALGDTNNQLAYDRMSQWKNAVDDFPLMPSGHGLGRKGTAAYHTGGGNDLIVDGGIFKILAEIGAPGVMLTLLGIFGAVAVLYRRLRETRGLQQTLCLTALAYVCGLAVQNIGSNIFDAFFVAPLAWTMMGFAVGPMQGTGTRKIQAVQECAPVNNALQ